MEVGTYRDHGVPVQAEVGAPAWLPCIALSSAAYIACCRASTEGRGHHGSSPSQLPPTQSGTGIGCSSGLACCSGPSSLPGHWLARDAEHQQPMMAGPLHAGAHTAHVGGVHMRQNRLRFPSLSFMNSPRSFCRRESGVYSIKSSKDSNACMLRAKGPHKQL